MYAQSQFEAIHAAAFELHRRRLGLSRPAGEKQGPLGCWYPANPQSCCAAEDGDLYAHCISADHVSREFGVPGLAADVEHVAAALHDDVLYKLRIFGHFCSD